MASVDCRISEISQRAELNAVLASRFFVRAPMRSRMLSYLCEKLLSNEAETISEYAIAIEALGRKSDFDPESDSIVRVEAFRLRQRLKEFYATEGADHAVQIVLPEGGYIPQFVQRTDDCPGPAVLTSNIELPSVDAVSTPLASPRNAEFVADRKKWTRALAIVLVVLALVVFAFIPSTTGRLASKRSDAAGTRTIATSKGLTAIPAIDALRVLCGYQGDKFVDASGRGWLGDRWFTGGVASVRPLRRIRGTRDERLYTTVRSGDFRYDVPLPPGYYELHLHFSESLDEDLLPDSDGEDRRRFDVMLNSEVKLNRFDIVTDAGGANVATERVFKDVTPAKDGKLHLQFRPVKGEALLNGFEIVPAMKGRMRTIRILCGTGAYSGAANASWMGDSYFRGGVATRHVVQIQTANDLNLYAGERYGNFLYSIPVADGTYRLTLRFAEFVFESNDTGRRVFDVNCNGTNLLKDFDILRASGGERRAVERTLHGLRPNAQGKLVLGFIPSKNYASVASIEVADESR